MYVTYNTHTICIYVHTYTHPMIYYSPFRLRTCLMDGSTLFVTNSTIYRYVLLYLIFYKIFFLLIKSKINESSWYAFLIMQLEEKNISNQNLRIEACCASQDMIVRLIVIERQSMKFRKLLSSYLH